MMLIDMLRLSSLVLILLSILVSVHPLSAEEGPVVGDVFSADSRSACQRAYQALLSLRRESTYAVQAIQAALDPEYGHTYQIWLEERAGVPDEIKPKFDRCANFFKQAIDTMKAVAPVAYQLPDPGAVKQINESSRRAAAMISEGDQCLNTSGTCDEFYRGETSEEPSPNDQTESSGKSSGCPSSHPNKLRTSIIGGGITWKPGCVGSNDPDYACCGCVIWPTDDLSVQEFRAKGLPVCADQKPEDPVETQPKDPTKDPLIGHIYYEPIECQNTPNSDPGIPKEAQYELMKMVSEMDQAAAEIGKNARAATDRFLQGTAQWASDTATFMAQKPGVPAQQTFEAIVQYLENDNEANHRELYNAAEDALKELKDDPAFFCGKNLPNLIPIPAAGKLKLVNRLKNGCSRIKNVIKSGGRLLARACSPQRKDCFWQSMLNATGDRSYLKKPKYKEVGKQELIDELRSRFGGPNAKDPLTGRPADLQSAAEGIPVDVTPDQFVDVLNRAPNGYEGLVIVQNSTQQGHVFNVAKLGDEFLFWDNQMRTSNLDIITAGYDRMFLYRYK